MKKLKMCGNMEHKEKNCWVVEFEEINYES